MNKKEWMDLFQSVNGRMPSEEEVLAAQKVGVWREDESSAPNPQSQVVEAPTQPEPVAPQKTVTVSSDTTQQQDDTNRRPTNRASFGGVFEAPSSQRVNRPSSIEGPRSHSYTVGASNPADRTSKSIRPIKPKSNIKWSRILMGLIAVFLVIAAVSGGYVGWRYKAADITGTWELTQWNYYDRNSSRWIDAIAQYEDNDYTYVDFITVDKEGKFHEDSYYYVNGYKDQPYLSLISFINDSYRVDRWNKTIEINKSPALFRQQVRRTLENELSGYYDYVESADMNDDIRSLTDVLNFNRTYTVKGDTLTVLTKDINDRTTSKAVYKRLSDKDAAALKKSYRKNRALFEENYHIK